MNCKLCKYREQVLGFEAEVGLAQESHHHHVEGIGTGAAGHHHHHDHDHHDHGHGHHHDHDHDHAHGSHDHGHHHHPYPHAAHPHGPVSLKKKSACCLVNGNRRRPGAGPRATAMGKARCR